MPWPGSHRRSNEGVAAERLVEVAEILVDSKREPHPLDRPLDPEGARRAKYDPIRRRLPRMDHDWLTFDVQEAARNAGSWRPQDSIAAAAAGQAVGPGRPDLDVEGAGPAQLLAAENVDVDQERPTGDHPLRPLAAEQPTAP